MTKTKDNVVSAMMQMVQDQQIEAYQHGSDTWQYVRISPKWIITIGDTGTSQIIPEAEYYGREGATLTIWCPPQHGLDTVVEEAEIYDMTESFCEAQEKNWDVIKNKIRLFLES